METLADLERVFLLAATGLPDNATLADLRYAYFAGLLDGSIGGREIPDGGSLDNVLAIANTSTGELKWMTSTVNATADTIAKRSSGGRLLVGTATGASDAVTKAQLDALAARVTTLEQAP